MIMQDELPGIKRFLKLVEPHAAQSIRSQSSHRANDVRFLAKQGWSGDWCVLAQVADLLLQGEAARGGGWTSSVPEEAPARSAPAGILPNHVKRGFAQYNPLRRTTSKLAPQAHCAVLPDDWSSPNARSSSGLISFFIASNRNSPMRKA